MRSEHSFVYLLAAAFCSFALTAQGQKNSSWRIYKAADGLYETTTTAVTVGPKNRIWVKHGESGAISWLDGYTVTNFAAPDGGAFRVYENRTGQLWTLYADGVREFKDNQWITHPIPEVRAENRTNPLRNVRPISLLPTHRDHLLILLSDRL